MIVTNMQHIVASRTCRRKFSLEIVPCASRGNKAAWKRSFDFEIFFQKREPESFKATGLRPQEPVVSRQLLVAAVSSENSKTSEK
jgi:hypothetical protein